MAIPTELRHLQAILTRPYDEPTLHCETVAGETRRPRPSAHKRGGRRGERASQARTRAAWRRTIPSARGSPGERLFPHAPLIRYTISCSADVGLPFRSSVSGNSAAERTVGGRNHGGIASGWRCGAAAPRPQAFSGTTKACTISTYARWEGVVASGRYGLDRGLELQGADIVVPGAVGTVYAPPYNLSEAVGVTVSGSTREVDWKVAAALGSAVRRNVLHTMASFGQTPAASPW